MKHGACARSCGALMRSGFCAAWISRLDGFERRFFYRRRDQPEHFGHRFRARMRDRVFSQRETHCFTPAFAAPVQCMTGSRVGHGEQPPALFGRQPPPVLERGRNQHRVGVFDCPREQVQLLAEQPRERIAAVFQTPAGRPCFFMRRLNSIRTSSAMSFHLWRSSATRNLPSSMPSANVIASDSSAGRHV